MKSWMERSSDWFDAKMKEDAKPIKNPMMDFTHEEERRFVRTMRRADPMNELSQIAFFVFVMVCISAAIVIGYMLL